MKALHLVLLCTLCIAVQSCKKKSAESTAPFDNDPIKTRTLKYFTQSPWKQTTLEYQTQSGTWIAKPLSAIQLAYVYAFTATGYSNGTYTIYNGNTTVNSTGTWVIIGDNTQLATNFTTTYDFAVLNDTTMQWELNGQMPYTDPSTNITTQYYGMRETFVH